MLFYFSWRRLLEDLSARAGAGLRTRAPPAGVALVEVEEGGRDEVHPVVAGALAGQLPLEELEEEKEQEGELEGEQEGEQEGGWRSGLPDRG